MFNYDFSSKRAKLAIRFFTYGVMAVASIVLTVLLVLVALGYRLDRNFNFSQGGLVQFHSFPDGATIAIDGKRQSIRTPDKANLPAGNHTYSMDLAGYRTWSKTTDLAAGQLLWLNYARLIPNSITTSPLKEYPAIGSSLASPDRHWLLMHPEQNTPNFALVDYSDERKPQYEDFKLSDDVFTKRDNKYGTFKIIEWDLQSKYVLIQHNNGGMVEFVRADRSKPDSAINLTRAFDLNILEAHFSGNNPSIIFAKTDDALRRLDTGSTTASGALVTGMRDFAVYGEDTIAFTAIEEKKTGDSASQHQLVGIYRGGKITPVRELPADQQIKLAYNEYDDHDYLAISAANNPIVDVIRDATATGTSKEATVYIRLDLGTSVDSLTFSNNGRMIMAQHGNKIATYDIETAKTYVKTLGFGSEKTSQFRWLDDYYLWTDDEGALRIFEFDGTNDHEIAKVIPGYDVMLSSNGKQLLSIGKNGATNKLLLQASKLTTEK